MTHLHLHARADRQRIDQPVHLARHDPAAEQRLARTNHDGALARPDRHDVHRLREAARHAAALADREAREAVVLAHHAPVDEHHGAAGERRRVAAEPPRDDLRVIAVGHEADVLALDLLGDDLEAERCARARVSAFVISPTGSSMRRTTERSMPQRK